MTDKQAGVSKQTSKVGRGKVREGGNRGVVGAIRVGFGVLGVGYGWWGTGCALVGVIAPVIPKYAITAITASWTDPQKSTNESTYVLHIRIEVWTFAEWSKKQ